MPQHTRNTYARPTRNILRFEDAHTTNAQVITYRLLPFASKNMPFAAWHDNHSESKASICCGTFVVPASEMLFTKMTSLMPCSLTNEGMLASLYR